MLCLQGSFSALFDPALRGEPLKSAIAIWQERFLSTGALPDTILVDLAPAEPLLVFIEAVATDGPITDARRSALLGLVKAAGFKDSQIAFVTAFQDRNAAAFRRPSRISHGDRLLGASASRTISLLSTA